MELETLRDENTGEVRLRLTPRSTPGGSVRLADQDAYSRHCVQLVGVALRARRLARERECQGDFILARAYHELARERARKALRLLWQLRGTDPLDPSVTQKNRCLKMPTTEALLRVSARLRSEFDTAELSNR